MSATNNAKSNDTANSYSDYLNRGELRISPLFCAFIEAEVLPDLDINAEDFWQHFSELLNEFTPRNKDLLLTRETMQTAIDQWHANQKDNQKDNKNKASDAEQIAFLREINYIADDVDDFTITTDNADDAIARIPGPQLVVPVKNARYALNATNARWGSLYDALYGTNVIESATATSGGYDAVRGAEVIRYVRQFLDQATPLTNGSHADASVYTIKNNTLVVTANSEQQALKNPEQFVGYTGHADAPSSILLKNNHLHIELLFDKNGVIGRDDAAGIQDIVLESAITTIQDCEDSVAAVDAEDKTLVYRNWLGLMRGTLQTSFKKGDKVLERGLSADREFLAPNGEAFSISGRSLLLVRNVGHLMTNDAVLDAEGEAIPEGIMDGIVTATIALYDMQKRNRLSNSTTGSMYIVKPKMHGPDEVKFTCDLFSKIEQQLAIPANSIKLGIMDEERRTSLNLKACIHAAKDRVIFINTGFLDRTGDEIHTAMEAGPILPKEKIKDADWISAYEASNVAIGLQCGFSGKAQIGKGMWAMPDEMKAMVETKDGHPKSGANCAWVPSPTAATLHVMHYHQTDVLAVQQKMLDQLTEQSEDYRQALVRIPVMAMPHSLDDKAIQQQLDNNNQGILGYVVRWINDGVGCSKVPNIHNVGLMEDRATLRISSQHVANWLHHNICTKDQVLESLQRMAVVVDGQNANDPSYHAMTADFDNSIAFKAACALIFEGKEQPSGYTEPLLHQMRRLQKLEMN
ncbi:malate synthase G [Pseudomonadales bacterium]|nr:malate synthase G [Pseudomonadales bacterium]